MCSKQNWEIDTDMNVGEWLELVVVNEEIPTLIPVKGW